MKQLRKGLAMLLTLALLASLLPNVLPAFADSIVTGNLTGHSFHSEGLWLTEIYPNDVNRSAAADTRAADGCYTVTTYDSTSDMMEFVEVISTHEEDFQFNDVYELYYNSKKLSVTALDGSESITVTKGQPMVIWNERRDVTGSAIPSADTFIKEMHIPENALVLKTSGGGWDPAGTFSLKLKSTGETFCSFTPVSDVDVKDGLSVELKMPFWKSETAMELYSQQNIPSPAMCTMTRSGAISPRMCPMITAAACSSPRFAPMTPAVRIPTALSPTIWSVWKSPTPPTRQWT